MSILMDLAYGVDSILLKSNLDVSMSAMVVTTLPGQLIKFSPNVRCVQYGYAFCGQ